MTHEDRPLDTVPAPAPRRRIGVGDFGAPDPIEVAEEARWLAEPPVAVITVDAWHGGDAFTALVTPQKVIDEHNALIREWLAGVRNSRPLAVPSALRVLFTSARALAVPMKSDTWTVGAIALPLSATWGPLARELENLGTEFAVRLVTADQRAQMSLRRTASVGRRPAGRRGEYSADAGAERVFERTPGGVLVRPRHRASVEMVRKSRGTGELPLREAYPAFGRR